MSRGAYGVVCCRAGKEKKKSENRSEIVKIVKIVTSKLPCRGVALRSELLVAEEAPERTGVPVRWNGRGEVRRGGGAVGRGEVGAGRQGGQGRGRQRDCHRDQDVVQRRRGDGETGRRGDGGTSSPGCCHNGVRARTASLGCDARRR